MWSSDDVVISVQAISLVILSFCCHWQRGRIQRLEAMNDKIKNELNVMDRIEDWKRS
jgi:hypothetical protein